jgi:hypothetical protein
MKYKNNGDTQIKTQSPKSLRSHFHTKEIIPKKEKTKVQTSLLLEQTTTLFLSIFLFHCHTKISFSISLYAAVLSHSVVL